MFYCPCYYLEPPTLFSACTTPACRTDAENALFRRTVCSLRGFESLNRRQKRNLLRFLFLFYYPCYYLEPPALFSPCTTPACRTDAENALFRRALRSLRGFVSAGRRQKRSRTASFLFFYFCYYLEPPTLFSACTTPACRTDAENALFRRALRSLRGFESLNRRQTKKETLAGFFFILLFLFTVSFLELLIFRFLSGQMFSVPKEKAAERM